MEQNIVLGNRMKKLMEEKGMTYRSLAEKCGLSERRIYRIANGGVANPSVFVMMRICKGLEVGLDEFFGTEEFKEIM